MAAFTNESLVREKFQLHDTALVSSALVATSIDDAHTELLRHLDPAFDTSPAEAALVAGETLLAGAHVYRSLAAKDAHDQKHVLIGGQRLEGGGRFAALIAVSQMVEKLAWYTLEPCLLELPARRLVEVTESRPVLGEV